MEGHTEGHTYERAKRTGNVMLALLILLTVVEFSMAVLLDGAVLLAGLALGAVVEAFLIAEYFMHLRQLRPHVATVWNAATRGLRD
ncbi:MAG: cytochrome C oxidase subunit IV family protein [Chloroflexi bacterium]|nr:cytochrome C oxidase subunit IV family protein [Chloroflexota bacterium]